MAHIFLWNEIIEREKIRELSLSRRNLRDAQNPFDIRESEFRRQFRVSRQLGRDLCHRLHNRLQRVRSSGLPVHVQVLVTLQFYAYGSYQRGVGLGFLVSMSQPSVSRCVKKVSNAIIEEYHREMIRFPTTVAERACIDQRFTGAAGFPGILGCIDCTHIAIVAPRDHEEGYKNHHGYHSLNVQMVCDEQCHVLAVNANFPGSVHDQFIWNSSVIKNEMKRLHQQRIGQYFLLGDSGYMAEPYLLTPILHAIEGSPEEAFTKRHCQVRNCIERCFGILKTRWRCLLKHRVLHYQPLQAGMIVNACVILHNLMLRNRMPLPDVPDEEEPQREHMPAEQQAGRQDAQRIRQDIVNIYFN